MQLACAIALTVIYVGVALALGGVHSKSGPLLWFFVPLGIRGLWQGGGQGIRRPGRLSGDIRATDGLHQSVGLYPRSVSDFYRELMAALSSLGIEVRIWPTPVEVAEPLAFAEDTLHAPYDADYARRFWLSGAGWIWR